MATYKTILKGGEAEYKDKGSTFLAIAFSIGSSQDFKSRLDLIKKEHPKANHHCFAYRIGTSGNEFRTNDDGEPSGSAGRPILGQLDSRNVTNAAVVVVRYFGGTLLGVPGLMNAYKMAASFALQVCVIEEKSIEVNYKIHCNYTDLNDVMRILKLFDGRLLDNDQGIFCILKAAIPKKNEESALSQLAKLYEVTTEMMP